METNRTTYRKPKPSQPRTATCTTTYHRRHDDHPRSTRLKRQRRRRTGQNDTQGEGRDPDDRMATSHLCAEIEGEAGVRSADHRKAEDHVCVSLKRKKDRIRAEELNNSLVFLSVQDFFVDWDLRSSFLPRVFSSRTVDSQCPREDIMPTAHELS